MGCIAHQFEALRDGDQFYYETALDPTEVAMVQATSLSDIIERDTDTNVMQADAFLTTERHTSSVAAENPNDLIVIVVSIGGTPCPDSGLTHGETSLPCHSPFRFGKNLRPISGTVARATAMPS